MLRDPYYGTERGATDLQGGWCAVVRGLVEGGSRGEAELLEPYLVVGPGGADGYHAHYG